MTPVTASDVTPQSVGEWLRLTQANDTEAIKGAEKKLEEAAEAVPNQLIAALVAGVAETSASVELRKAAAIMLRSYVSGVGGREPLWEDLEPATHEGVKGALLTVLGNEAGTPLRRDLCQAIATVAESVGSDFDEVHEAWPALLPALSQLISVDDTAAQGAGLMILKELTGTLGDGLMAKGGAFIERLQQCVGSSSPEIRTASVRLVLGLIEDIEPKNAEVLIPSMPGVVAAIQGLSANNENEQYLKEILGSLINAADEEPEFFKANGLQELWGTLISLCGNRTFSTSDIRLSAMEATMSFVAGLAKDFCEPQGQPLLEQVIGLNIEWMLEVEEDEDTWTSAVDEDDDDEMDGTAMQIGEENLDRLAEKCAELDRLSEKTTTEVNRVRKLEDVFMPMLFKVIRLFGQTFPASWQHTRACIMAVVQVVEHIEEEAWVDQSVEYIIQNLHHPHPRVRFVCFVAIGQFAYDHEPYVQENHSKALLDAIVPGIDDINIRVATEAVSAFVSLGEGLDADDLEEHNDALVTKLFARLQEGATRSMQENCLAAIAVVSELAEELFIPYYKHIVPLLKQMIQTKGDEKDRTLRGKSFECFSLVGEAVGKEAFEADAHEVMKMMGTVLQEGFADDDKTREYIHEACGRIASVLEQDFKPYVPALLPGIFAVIGQTPKEVSPEDLPDDDDIDDEKKDMSLLLVGEKVVGLKTSVLEEMRDSLSLILTLIQALGTAYCEFLPTTCQYLLPLLHFQLSEEVREKAFKTWEVLAEVARKAADEGLIQKTDVRQLVGEFLKSTIAAMSKTPELESAEGEALSSLQAQATGISGVISKAGEGVLAQDEVTTIVTLCVMLIKTLGVTKSEPAESAGRKRKGKAPRIDDDDNDDLDVEEGTATRQSARVSLADVAGALMRSNREEFIAVGLTPFMDVVKELLQPNASDGDRSLAFYIADDVVEFIADRSTPHWNTFMEPCLRGLTDKNAIVRQYAASTIGNGARQPIFAQMAPAAASAICQILTKQGERHRRRRAAKADALQAALALDSCILALGRICEFQEQTLGVHAGAAWKCWLTNLPLRYDQEEGLKAHKQLLDLVVRQHPLLTSAENLPKVFGVLGEVYKGNLSNKTLDKEIVATVTAAADTVRQIMPNLAEKQAKRLEAMLKDGSAADKDDDGEME